MTSSPTPMDFLTQISASRLRREIQNITDSYSHAWDILAELSQNAVDAISLHKIRYGQQIRQHEISFTINSSDRSISVSDTGVGFSPDKFLELFAPHGTDKGPSDPVIGEKGVGLTYAIFSSNVYSIDTRSTDGLVRGEIRNALLWRKMVVEDVPKFQPSEIVRQKFDPANTYTRITLRDVENRYDEADDIFHQSARVIEYYLRTKTAIGCTKGIMTSEPELGISVSLTLTNTNGQSQTMAITPRYMLPSDLITDVVNLEDFVATAASLDDRQKARQLQGKALMKKGVVTRAGRQIKYYCFMAPTRSLYDDISVKNELIRPTESESLDDDEKMYSEGLYVATRGMPTGITLEPPVGGSAGYWPNFYMILEDDSIVFDLGRKSVPNRTKGLLRDIARSLFNEFRPWQEYIKVDPAAMRSPTLQAYAKNLQFREFESLPDLQVPDVKYLKLPNDQEAAVVALFHQLVGAGVLKGYYTLTIGYKMTYDMWGYYQPPKEGVGANIKLPLAENERLPIVVEFKTKAEAILRDLEMDKKFFTDIDLIVCWDLDAAKFKRDGVSVEVIKPEDRLFFGSNYRLIWPGAYNLGAASEKPVLALRRFIEDHLQSR